MTSLRDLPAPEPRPELWQRILRSRAAGVRIALPSASAPRRSSLYWLAASAVIAAVGIGLAQESPQDTPRPKYPLISSDSLKPDRLSEGIWTYQSETTTDDILTRPSGENRIQLRRVTYAASPAWMVNTARRFGSEPWKEFTDTTYVDASSLRPKHAVAYGYKRRTRFVQRFDGDSGYESLEITGPMQGSFRGAVAFPFPRNAFFVNDWSLDRFGALLPAIPLASGWRGSFYHVAFVSRIGLRGVTPVDLRVAGRDRVTVPAGTFDCWRVEVETHQREAQPWTIWVSRDRGWIIKVQTRGSDYVVNKVLQSYEPGS